MYQESSSLRKFLSALDLVLFRPRASAPRAKLTFNCLSLPRDPLTASCAPPTANFQTPHKSRPTFNYFRSPDSAAACKRSFCFFTQLFFTQCQNSNSKQLTWLTSYNSFNRSITFISLNSPNIWERTHVPGRPCFYDVSHAINHPPTLFIAALTASQKYCSCDRQVDVLLKTDQLTDKVSLLTNSRL